MASLSETIQNILAAIANIFKRKPTSIEKMSQDDLLKQKAILENNETKILNDIEKLEAEKIKLFEEAKNADSKSMMEAIARKIHTTDKRIKGLQATLGPLGQRISALDRFINMKEMGNLAPNTNKIIDVLRETDSEQIQQEVDKQLAQDLRQDEKMDDTLESFKMMQEQDDANFKEDEEIKSIMEQIEQAQAMDASVEEIALLKEHTQPETAPKTKDTPMAQ